MNENFITALNVYDTAITMMDLDMSLIKPKCQQDAEPFIRELNTAFENFKRPFKNKNSDSNQPSYYSPILLFDEHLTALLKATQNLYAILSNEGKRLLKQSVDLKIKETKAIRKSAIASLEKEASLFYE